MYDWKCLQKSSSENKFNSASAIVHKLAVVGGKEKSYRIKAGIKTQEHRGHFKDRGGFRSNIPVIQRSVNFLSIAKSQKMPNPWPCASMSTASFKEGG